MKTYILKVSKRNQDGTLVHALVDVSNLQNIMSVDELTELEMGLNEWFIKFRFHLNESE